ncbi:MAG: aspartate kinase [Candidatus Obscuribacterales bacterium]|nr:aspartate kinase [Candidatus Obscuribacterales bacterium]
MPRLVQKFGGSSVKDAEHILRVAKIVADTAREGKELVVVVSAMGDTTDELIKLAAEISDNPDRREMDMLLATGEQISIALLTLALQKFGLKARSFTGPQAGILTDETHSFARIKTVHTTRLEASLRRGEIAVVAGFQGMTRTSEVTTLGRGGSDTTAVALAAALKAECCDIYTDVDGVYTTDPRSCEAARRLHAVSYEEMLELAFSGAQVLNARSVELAMKNRVPIRLRSTFKPTDTGTLVTSREFTPNYKICGLACDVDNVSFKLIIGEDFSTEKNESKHQERLKKLIDDLHSSGVDGLDSNAKNTSELSNLEFLCQKRISQDIQSLLKEFVSELPGSEFFQDNEIAKLSLVGSGIGTDIALASEFQSILNGASIPTRFVTTSDISISAIIPQSYRNSALNKLHQKFCAQNLEQPLEATK